MIHSMTAFARSENQGEWGTLTCEIRSINHRYLEVSVYLPEMLRAMEMPVRELMRKHIKRGKVECSIRYQPSKSMADSVFKVNTVLAQELAQACIQVTGLLTNPAAVDPMDVLRYPGVLESQSTDLASMQQEMVKVVDKALGELVATRAREGEELKQLFLQRMQLMQVEIKKVRTHLPQVLEEQKSRLYKRFTDANVELDPTRLEQEMLLYAQRIDVAEEIERLETHIAEVKRVLNESGPSGRRLDFLLQELNREANTLASKSVNPLLTRAAVEMKVLIEQIREQVQNIE